MESASTPPDCDNCVYTSCYCEENIYWLVERFLALSEGKPQWDIFAVFISNSTKTVALWNQRMGSCKDTEIIWDYHVVLALRERSQAHNPLRSTWIYDLDTRLSVPCFWNVYVDQTFPLGGDITLQYRRVVPGKVYLDNFASNRSHMLQAQPNASGTSGYLSEPPPYDKICGPEAEKRGVVHNLMTHFVSMAEEGFGTVMDFESFTAWCSQ